MSTPQQTGFTITNGFQLTNGYTFTGAAASDPYWNYVSYLSQSLSVNAAQNNTFLDASTNNATITPNGTPTQGTSAPFGSNWSNYFPGSAYLTGTANALNQLTGDFTIEFWAYASSLSGQQGLMTITNITSSSTNGLSIYFNTGNILSFFVNGNGTITSTSATYTNNTWYHIALVRSGSTNTLYVNGVSSATSATTPTWPTTPSIGVGRLYNDNTSFTFTGYISNLRIVKGTAVYTGNFTPPTKPLTLTQSAGTNIAAVTAGVNLLTSQSPSFADLGALATTYTVTGSPTVSKFNPFSSYVLTPSSYATKFNGSSDYLQSPTYSANLNPGASDFTIEFWVYALASSRQDWFNLQASAGTNRILVYYTASGAIQYDAGVGSAATSRISSAVSSANLLNQWHHVALSRNAGSSRLFLDGVQIGSTFADTLVWTNPLQFTTSKDPGGSTYATGYMSNIRFIVGTGLYTSNFTPPTSPLTAVSGTQLLTCQNATTVDNSTNAFALTLTGTPTPYPFNPFSYTTSGIQIYDTTTYGGSMYFNGTTDYLTAPNNSSYVLGTNDFTVEAWVYLTGAGSSNITLASFNYDNSVPSGNWGFYLNGSGPYTLYFNNSAANHASSTTVAIPLNTWTHIAYTRVYGTTTGRFFVNGILIGTTVTDNTNYSGSTGLMYVGRMSAAAYYLPGYMTNLRVVNGTALYISNFAPSLTPLTAVTNTQLLLNCTNAAIYDASMNDNLLTVANAQVNTTVTKYGVSSIAFDGTTDSIQTVDKPSINFGTGDFTLECWVYFNAVNAEMTVINKGWQQSGSVYASYLIYMTSAGSLRFNASSAGSSWDIANEVVIGAMTAGTWTYIAVTRSGTTFRAFINGVIVPGFTFTSASSLANLSAQALYIGGRVDGNSSLNGYLSDVRITKGIARYTTSFTPPTNTLPNS
jgi:hypothetical protein